MCGKIQAKTKNENGAITVSSLLGFLVTDKTEQQKCMYAYYLCTTPSGNANDFSTNPFGRRSTLSLCQKNVSPRNRGG